ncbi:hypothetical protein DVH05_019162 [Phytophthora capsici]|nr:hypothetical protein DVH05_019162 [Phytophthora capsici]|eukprot:jgi/Phyca11/551933/estExt2_Genewise1Plus.C_PHYCAscaffold_440248
MGKSTDRNIAAEKEFTSLAQVLVQTADDAALCLKLLKKNLSEYDRRNGHHLRNTAKSFMRSDIRNAKDISSDLKHVAHQIHRSHKYSKMEVASARNMMNTTANAMEVLKATARHYDEKNGQTTGVKGAIKRMLSSENDEPNDSKGGLFGRKSDQVNNQGAFGNGERHGGGLLGSPDTVEALVKSTLRDNFNMNVLSYQISAAEKVLSPSLVDRAKEAVHDVKDKLKGDKTTGGTMVTP